MRLLPTGFTVVCLCLILNANYAQSGNAAAPFDDSLSLRIPTKSQFAAVSQTIGISDVTISYFRPSVDGRKIWGNVVKYNSVWVAGAENATKFHFHDNVEIDGQSLQKGDYAFFIIPRDSMNWTVIFNKNPNQHNTFHYKDAENVLKFNVKVMQSPFQESLTYSIADVKYNSAKVRMQWENKMIEFKVAFDENQLVWDNIQKYVSNNAKVPDSTRWHDYMSIGNYCILTRNKAKADYAINLVDQTFGILENFENLKMKSDLLALKGDYQGASIYAKKALDSNTKLKIPAEVDTSLKASIKRYQEILAKSK